MSDSPADRLEKAKTGPRSVSQVNQYLKCGYSWYLERVLRAWQKPAAWLAQGTAMHKAGEEYERSERSLTTEETREVFRESYAEEIERYAKETPNLDYWFSSGPYRGPEDIERRFHIGLGQVDRYVDYYEREAPNEVIWITPDGEPAIELGFDIDLDGVKVRGFIDQVVTKPGYPAFNDAEGHVRVRDLKSGNQPGDTLQLKVYAVAIEELYDVPVAVGDYWMGPNKRRKGGPTKPYDLTTVSRQQVVDKFHEVDAGIKAERFDPDPDPDKCRFCSVQTACRFSAA